MNKSDSSQNLKIKFATYKLSISYNMNEQLEIH